MSVQIDYYTSYLSAIRNSAGSRMFQSLYVEKDGKTFDALEGGELSCAFYVTSILYLFHLIPKPHATLKSTYETLQKAGWKEQQTPLPGDVLFWEEIIDETGDLHGHAGFFLEGTTAVSNSTSQKEIAIHDMYFSDSPKGPRKIVTILRSPHF